MNDTAPDVAEYVSTRYAEMDPEDRFLIGIRMFDTALAILEASIPASVTGRDRRRQICRRLYPALEDQVFPKDA
jgi:hypothetical protein